MKVIGHLIFTLPFFIYLSNPLFNSKAEYQAKIEIVSNPEQLMQREKQFSILDKKALDRKFNLVSVDTDSENNLFVLDTMEKKILKFDKEGVFQTIIESGMFVEPDFLLIDSSNLIYVRDRKNLHIFSGDGNHYKCLSFHFYIGDYAVTRKNLILVENSSRESGWFIWRLEMYDLNGIHIKTLFEHQEKVSGETYTFPSPFHPRLLVRQNKRLTLFAFTGDYKLYIVDESGNIKSIIKKKEKPLPVTKKDIRDVRAVQDSVWIPKYKPLFYDIFIDDKDDIYVEKWPTGRPSWESRYFDCFDRKGKFLYIINRLPRLVIIKIQKDKLITAEPLKGSPYLQLSISRYSIGE